MARTALNRDALFALDETNSNKSLRLGRNECNHSSCSKGGTCLVDGASSRHYKFTTSEEVLATNDFAPFLHYSSIRECQGVGGVVRLHGLS